MKAKIKSELTVTELVIEFKEGYLTPGHIKGHVDVTVDAEHPFNGSERTHVEIQIPILPKKLLADLMAFCKKNTGVELITEPKGF